jgi:hypothetical protein
MMEFAIGLGVIGWVLALWANIKVNDCNARISALELGKEDRK